MGFDVRCSGDYIVNVSVFEERSIIGESDEVWNQIYHRIEDQFLVFMKSIPLSEDVNESEIDDEIEKLINLRHPCIAAPIGFIFPPDSDNQEELKIVRLYLEGCSLSEVLSVNPSWWTSTVKAKAVAGIVLGLRFAHSLGFLHGHLTTNNILFDSDHHIQIVDFKSMLLDDEDSEDGTQFEVFSAGGWTPERDIQAFASILSELVVGDPATSEISISTGIPDFVSRIIDSRPFLTSRTRYSLNTVLEILKENDFRIEGGVDSAEVSRFVSWVESAEQFDE
jgi:serine/threonine protein kinase